ncbi:MAG: DUF1835 domain-containing protein, partial [Bacteroidota bacterium]|nr:DUF1835 domain-containing protein [Bacteroidota bacterium]
MFHIVFDSRGAGLLNEAMDTDDGLDGETILLHDDYSVGPIRDLISEEGSAERQKWWEEVRDKERDPEAEEYDPIILKKLVERMAEEEFDQVWIWVAANTKDVCGYYRVLSELQAFSGRVYVVHLNNLPFISEKGNVFYPNFLSEIPAREYIKAKKLVRCVYASEFETDAEEWNRLAAENKNLRLLEGGKKITQQADDYYDKAILHFLQPVFQKIHRAIQHFLLKSPDKLNEYFLSWRLRQLVASGAAE